MDITDLTLGDEVKLGPRPAVQPYVEGDTGFTSVHPSFANATGVVEVLDRQDGSVVVRVNSNPDIWPRGLTQWVHVSHLSPASA